MHEYHILGSIFVLKVYCSLSFEFLNASFCNERIELLAKGLSVSDKYPTEKLVNKQTKVKCIVSTMV